MRNEIDEPAPFDQLMWCGYSDDRGDHLEGFWFDGSILSDEEFDALVSGERIPNPSEEGEMIFLIEESERR